MRIDQHVSSLLEEDMVVRHVLDVAGYYRNNDESEWKHLHECVFFGNSVHALDMQFSVPIEKLRGFHSGISKSLAPNDHGKLTLLSSTIAKYRQHIVHHRSSHYSNCSGADVEME